jgi:hypothetical protein
MAKVHAIEVADGERNVIECCSRKSANDLHA